MCLIDVEGEGGDIDEGEEDQGENHKGDNYWREQPFHLSGKENRFHRHF